MRIWKVLTPDRARELVRVGALVKGRVMAVEGDRVLIDFGDFVGEGRWEATQPLPSEGDVILVRIAGEGVPIPLRFVKRLKVAEKEVAAKRLPEIEVRDVKSSTRELAAILRLATKVAEHTHQQVRGAGEHQQHTPMLFVSIPVVVEGRHSKVYMAIDEEPSGGFSVYNLRLLLEETPVGDVRVDLSYVPEKARRLMVSIFTAEEKGAEVLEKARQELVRALSSLGFSPMVYVRHNPKVVGKVGLISFRGGWEVRA